MPAQDKATALGPWRNISEPTNALTVPKQHNMGSLQKMHVYY